MEKWILNFKFCKFTFFIFIPLFFLNFEFGPCNIVGITWKATYATNVMSTIATSCAVRHFDIFLTEVDGRDEIQKVINLQGLF